MVDWRCHCWTDCWDGRRTARNVLCTGKASTRSPMPPNLHFAPQIATLPAEYGLYSSFVGVLIYCVSFLAVS